MGLYTLASTDAGEPTYLLAEDRPGEWWLLCFESEKMAEFFAADRGAVNTQVAEIDPTFEIIEELQRIGKPVTGHVVLTPGGATRHRWPPRRARDGQNRLRS